MHGVVPQFVPVANEILQRLFAARNLRADEESGRRIVCFYNLYDLLRVLGRRVVDCERNGFGGCVSLLENIRLAPLEIAD